MDEQLEVQQMPSARLRGIHLNILSDDDAKCMSSKVIETVQEVTDATLGLPSQNSSECFTCGAKSLRACEGHFGLINLPYTVFNPYYLSEIAKVLNRICPGCKSYKKKKTKDDNSIPNQECKYCNGKSRGEYPRMRFRVSSKDVFAKTAIIAEIYGPPSPNIASDYWDVIPKDFKQSGSAPTNKSVLLPSQVYSILQGVSSETLEELFKRKNSIFLSTMLLTPNHHRLREFSQRLTSDETTPIYKRIVDFRGTPNELTACVLDRYKASKVRSEKLSFMDQGNERQSKNDPSSSSSGLKNIKELLLAKRTENTFRMVVVGDPHIKVDEIGIPSHVAQNLQIPDLLNLWNWEKIENCCDSMLYLKGALSVHRKEERVSIYSKDMLQVGDKLDRPLMDGDTVLINRPPSIHQHSLIALTVKALPTESVISINPLVCSPLRGDFDGDCIHGFVPQSVDARIELDELVSLRSQLTDGQNGDSLLAFGQDSLTAAYLVLEDGVTLTRSEVQQLQMFCPNFSSSPLSPAIFKANGSLKTSLYTGKQLFDLLFPENFSYEANGVKIVKGELVLAHQGSSWLRSGDDNLYNHFIKSCPEKFLDFLGSGQEMLCEWITKRGLTVSLSDLYLATDSQSRANLSDEISYGLQEAEELSRINLLMVEENREFLMGYFDEDEEDTESSLKPTSSTNVGYFEASSAFKMVSGVMQNLVYKFAGNNNSFVDMLKAGSKGNLQKLVQHSMCLGLQHSLSPLAFAIPRDPSCSSWNLQKEANASQKVEKLSIPFATVAHSFLDGLNPLECFMGSVTARDGSFSGNADVSGTIARRIMFFMRDLVTEYDGTVRSCQGNQIVQFCYDLGETCDDEGDRVVSGHPVGSLAACAISEAAYGALDQPVTALEPSPLLTLKEVLECGVKRRGRKSASLFLSRRLRRWANGIEYGALEVKDHLESFFFADVVSQVKICFSKEKNTSTSPWICHFHINKEELKKRRLTLRSIVDALNENCEVSAKKLKLKLPKLLIASKIWSESRRGRESDYCISVSLLNRLQDFSDVDILSDLVQPVLLQTVIKGFPEFKKVEITWRDDPSQPKATNRHHSPPSGELFVRVFMSDCCDASRFWSVLQDSCMRVRDIIDWDRSYPDDIRDMSESYGIDAAWNRFVTSLNSAVNDTGKKILPQHLVVTANCMTMTGEFVPLNARGLANQRKELDIYSPFVQAAFSNPSDSFVQAAKMEQVDNLKGSLEALAWGQTPPIGTGAQFDIIHSGKGHEIAKPTDILTLMSTHTERVKPNDWATHVSEKSLPVRHFKAKEKKVHLSKVVQEHLSREGLYKISRQLKQILREYPLDTELREEDKLTAMRALHFHPRSREKFGAGIIGIKVGRHPEHRETCFFLVRSDGSEEDFSYNKCIRRARELISHERDGDAPPFGKQETAIEGRFSTCF